MSNITKATIERLAIANGASEQALGNIVSQFEQCSTDKEREELHAGLVKRFGGIKAAQDKADGAKTPGTATKRSANTKG